LIIDQIQIQFLEISSWNFRCYCLAKRAFFTLKSLSHL